MAPKDSRDGRCRASWGDGFSAKLITRLRRIAGRHRIRCLTVVIMPHVHWNSQTHFMRPIFTIHAGEYPVGSAKRMFPKVRVWVPSKGDGIDLLVTDRKCTRAVSLQVRFSKDYLGSDVHAALAEGSYRLYETCSFRHAIAADNKARRPS